MTVNDSETEQHGRVMVFFFNFTYSHIKYVTRMNIVSLLLLYRYFQVITTVNDCETEQYAECKSVIMGPVSTLYNCIPIESKLYHLGTFQSLVIAVQWH